eukprot:Seg3165.4 transcript_id=Seg3165.4/GoldUCD/mRNA.D3Y31 product="hypothetical protein" protein_id=Seg3165.4/GoldUCD/D3Y31
MAHVTRGQGICAIVFGVLKLLLGIAIIIIGLVLSKKIDNGVVSSYWGGFIYVVPGILGIIAGATKNNCCMIAYMVINIILFILVGIGCIVIFIAVGAYSTVISDVTNNCAASMYNKNQCVCAYQGTSYTFGVSCDVISNLTSILWAVAVFYLLAGILLLASSILGCVSSCCTQPPPTGFMYQEQPPAQYQPSVVISSQQQMATGYSPPAYTPPAKPGMI